MTKRSAKTRLKALLILASQLIALNASAAGKCFADKSDISEDMSKINAKLALKYANSDPLKAAQNVTIINQIYDEQQLKVDRSDPFLKQVDAVGVITDAPLGTQQGYATAVLISPCHVLVNALGVMKENAKLGKTPVYISLGQNACDSKNEFAHQDMLGYVIAIGDTTPEAESVNSTKDFAIVKIQSIQDIEFALISTEFMTFNDSILTVGFPFKYTYSQNTGLRYPTINFTRKTAVGIDGTFRVLNKENLPGASGSGMFVLDQDERGKPQIVVGAIFIGPHKDGNGGIGLQTPAILQYLEATNLKAYNEVKTAIQKNACNKY